MPKSFRTPAACRLFIVMQAEPPRRFSLHHNKEFAKRLRRFANDHIEKYILINALHGNEMHLRTQHSAQEHLSAVEVGLRGSFRHTKRFPYFSKAELRNIP